MLSKLTPKYTYKIWGGLKLSKAKSLDELDTELPLGETWEISTHKDGSSQLAGHKLSGLCNLTYLVKFIDTADNLSVQVHPGDEYARAHEDSLGKTECWIILDHEPGAGIYLGFKPGVTKKEFKTAIENGLDVEKYLNYFEVKKGDYFYVPYGAVHAIGSNVTLCEVQQSSGITYRVWDWNRVDADGVGRELHIEKALDVLNFKEEFNKALSKRRDLYALDGFQKIVEHDDFKADLISIRLDETIEVRLREKEGVAILEGEILIDGEKFSKFESGIEMKEGVVNIKATQSSKIILVRE